MKDQGQAWELLLRWPRPFGNTFWDHEVIDCTINDVIIGEPARVPCNVLGSNLEAQHPHSRHLSLEDIL